MSTVNNPPVADFQPPTPATSRTVGGAQQTYGIMHMMVPFTEGAGRAGSTFGATAKRGRHCVFATDYDNLASALDNGRYLDLWTDGGSGLPAKTFHASGDFQLEGAVNTEPMEGVAFGGHVLMCDGEARNVGPGGFVDPTAVHVEDNGTGFTNETVPATDDVTDDVAMLPATPALNDAFYLGYSATFRHGLINLSTSGVGTYTITWEYFNGAAFVALAGVTDGTLGFQAGTGFRTVFFTVPGDWASTTVNSVAAFYIRGRISAFTSSTTVPRLTRAFVFPDVAPNALGPVAYHIGDNPASIAPDVIGWGIDNWWSPITNIVPSALGGILVAGTYQVRASYYDSARDIESAVGPTSEFTIAAAGTFNFTTHTHLNPEVDSIRVYIRLKVSNAGDPPRPFEAIIATTSLVVKRTALPIAAGTTNGLSQLPGELQDENRNGGGPHYAQDGETSRNGTPISVMAHEDRVWTLGGNVIDSSITNAPKSLASRVLYSSRNLPHNFPAGNFIDIDADDGDPGVAIRAARGTRIVLKTRSIHTIIGEPGSGALQSKRIAGVGCIAKRTAVEIDGAVFFMSQSGVLACNGAGLVGSTPFSDAIRDLIDAIDPTAVANACATYDRERELYLVAVPGVQGNLVSGAAPVTPLVNEVTFALHIPTGQWSTWPMAPAASFAAMYADDGSTETWRGDYVGRVHRLDDTQFRDGQQVAGVSYSGTALPGSNTTNIISAGGTGWLTAGADDRMLGLVLWLLSGTGAGQARQIVDVLSTTNLTVDTSFTTAPDGTTVWVIAEYEWLAEFGDWDFGQPEGHKALHSVRVHLQQALGTGDAIDFAVDPTDLGDTATAMTYAAGTVGAIKEPRPVVLPFRAGHTVRLRMQGRLRSTRPVVRGLTLKASTLGNPRG